MRNRCLARHPDRPRRVRLGRIGSDRRLALSCVEGLRRYRDMVDRPRARVGGALGQKLLSEFRWASHERRSCGQERHNQ